MNIRRKQILLPVAFAAGSFLLMIILAAITSPIENITYAIYFFALAAVFLVSGGYSLTYLRHGKVGARSRYRIFVISFLILIGVMLRSSQALNWVDGLVLILIGCGLWFYAGRR